MRDAEAGLTAGRTVGQICQEIGVSEQTYYRWKSLYGGMKTNELRRLKELEQENLRLKKHHRHRRDQCELIRLMKTRGAPAPIRSDNGPEFIATPIRTWLARAKVGTLYVEPGAPWFAANHPDLHLARLGAVRSDGGRS